MEPHSRDTHLIWTPTYNRQLFSNKQIAKHIFFKYGHQSIQVMDTFLRLNRKLLHIVNPLYTGYLHTGYFLCHNHVLLVDFSNNDRSLSVNAIFFTLKNRYIIYMYLCLFLICFEGCEFISILYCQVPPSKNKVDYN